MKRLLLLLSFASCLFADIEDYFKPVVKAEPHSQMKNIDFIYLINLDEREEKLQHTIDMLAPYDIAPCRFSAVNGWELSLEAVNDLGVPYESWMPNGRWVTYYPLDGDKRAEHEIAGIPGRTYFGHCLSLGSMGCVLSHLSVLQDAWDSGYEVIWVIEDDIEIIQNPHLLSDRIEELEGAVGKNGWDVLFTDKDTKNTQGENVPCSSYAWRPNYTPSNAGRFAQKTEISDHITQIGARYGSYSMLLRRTGMEKILNFFKCHHIFLPYDMEYTQPATVRLFCLKDDVVSTQPMATSDNGSPNYLPKKDI